MFEIADYDELYRPYDKSGRELKHADWVKLPAKPKGDGLQILLEHDRGLEVFGIWCLLLEKATIGKPENRGKLLNHKDKPATVEEITKGISLKKKVRLVRYALSCLTTMGWVNYAPSGDTMSLDVPKSCTKSRVEKSRVEKSNQGGVAFPSNLDCPEFRQVWKDWETHRTEIRHKLTPTAIDHQLKMLAGHPVAVAINIIKTSIRNSWRGLFPESKQGGSKKTKLYPIKGRMCSETGCGMPAVYKSSTGAYDWYYCSGHLPEKVKAEYE